MFGLCILACPTTSCARKGSGTSSFSNVFKGLIGKNSTLRIHSLSVFTRAHLMLTWIQVLRRRTTPSCLLCAWWSFCFLCCVMRVLARAWKCETVCTTCCTCLQKGHCVVPCSFSWSCYVSMMVGASHITLEIDVNISRVPYTCSSEHTNPSLFRFPYKARGQCYCYSWFFLVTKNLNLI